ncbi:Isoleucyl-tRNA synthetase [Spironucleus salmonicida]|uniref:isoleucine--tRNA ligase n=1 Tax=Spironucleus salmonicida TaxID=348837 RepID=V6LIT6_9EUKA|nr:Isoleucyl-tRNA synthetase [Spironucleus salmonicida]|eukprot:EST44472.1 Isoleucyl-tRNA synthetase [Spironucleus salmonicida]
MFNPVDFDLPPQSLNFPQMETQVLNYWEEIDAFQEQMKLTEHLPKFHFFDGPPFATGLPHYGHLLAGTIKDVVCRYQSQNGRYVPRRFGWDTHGLPVEYEIDQKLGITSPQQIRDMGIHNYNEECRAIVTRYAGEWETIVKRSGRWIDFKNDYKTLKPEFMESVWWVFKQLWQKNMVYQGVKVMPYSTGCATSLSNFEAGQNYKDVQDPCCIVSFPVIGEDFSICAWTTTPWTLPSNLALCVNEGFDYIQVKDLATSSQYIVLENRITELYPENKKDKTVKYEIIRKVKGKDLVGLKYQPLFDYFSAYSEKYNAHRVLSDNYVTADSGTGIVHMAPFFGEDDYRVCLLAGIITKDSPIVCPVDESGKFTEEVTHFKGIYVKDADKSICKHLKESKRLFSQATCTHSYPFCWRSETPLIYRAIPSWFVRVEDIKEDLIRNNKKAEWVPSFVQEKRFHNWLANARDWAISRNRFWGCPIPVWSSEDGKELICIESIEELRKLSGVTVTDLHREFVDSIEIPDPRGPSYPPMKRIAPVFDCWFESGSMPYAQSHYPFSDTQFREQEDGLADFIAEGLDQTRGWFYTLLILSTILFDKPPAKHCIVNGLVLAENGQKMSKRLKNYPPVEEVLDNYGADAMRMYLCQSPAVRAQELRFRYDGVKDVIKDVFLPWFNSFRFFAQNVIRYQQTNIKFEIINLTEKVEHVMDKWVLAAFEKLTITVKREMEAYKLYNVLPELIKFLNDLTNWYIRFNRSRMKGTESLNDSNESLVCLNVLFFVLINLCKLMAPFTPFLTEYMYHQLMPLLPEEDRFKSIHFHQMPAIQPGTFQFNDPLLIEKIEAMKNVIMLGRMCRRDKCNISSFKAPLRSVTVVHDSELIISHLQTLKFYIASELNVLDVILVSGEANYAKIELEPNFKKIREVFTGKELAGAIKAVKEFCALMDADLVKKLRYEGEVVYQNITISKEFCAVNLAPIAEFGASADENGFLTQFDLKQDAELVKLALERDFFSRIQQARKSAGLQLNERRNLAVKIVSGEAEIGEIVKKIAERVNGDLCVEIGCQAEEDDFEVGDVRWRISVQ